MGHGLTNLSYKLVSLAFGFLSSIAGCFIHLACMCY